MSSPYLLALPRLCVYKVIPGLNGKLISIAFHVPTSQCVSHEPTWYLEKAAKYSDSKKVVKQALEGPLRGIWATLRTRLSPATLTGIPTPPILTLGLTLLSTTL